MPHRKREKGHSNEEVEKVRLEVLQKDKVGSRMVKGGEEMVLHGTESGAVGTKANKSKEAEEG